MFSDITRRKSFSSFDDTCNRNPRTFVLNGTKVKGGGAPEGVWLSVHTPVEGRTVIKIGMVAFSVSRAAQEGPLERRKQPVKSDWSVNTKDSVGRKHLSPSGLFSLLTLPPNCPRWVVMYAMMMMMMVMASHDVGVTYFSFHSRSDYHCCQKHSKTSRSHLCNGVLSYSVRIPLYPLSFIERLLRLLLEFECV